MSEPFRIRDEVDLMRAFERWLYKSGQLTSEGSLQEEPVALSYEGPKDNLDETLAELSEPTCTVCGKQGDEVDVQGCGICRYEEHLLCGHCYAYRNPCMARREDFE